MSNGWPCIVIAVLCCLLAVVTSAVAEGAWVLWEKVAHSHDPNPVWTIKGAHENRKTCDSALAREMSSRQTEMVRDGSMRIRAAGKDWLIVIPTVAKPAESYSVSFNYSCLPDTVDPRGPKGK